MGVPKLNITFHAAAEKTARKLTRGTVALIMSETASSDNPSVLDKLHELKGEDDIPAALSDENKAYIKRAFVGGAYKPEKVWAYIVPTSASEHETSSKAAYTTALDALSRVSFDWLTYKSADADIADAVKAWIETQRGNGKIYKAVIPSEAVAKFDNEAIVNFVARTITAGDGSYNAASFSSRIAGIIAGTPPSAAVTFHVIPEVSDVSRFTDAEQDQLVDDGALILIHDGVKVKIARGVTSLTTTTGKIDGLKKITVIDAIDTIKRDLKLLSEDNYVGKYKNTYDNKCLLLTAIKSYFKGLEQQEIIEKDTSTAELNIEAIRKYLITAGVDVSRMTEQELKKADTGSAVFIRASLRIYDSIEDINIEIAV